MEKIMDRELQSLKKENKYKKSLDPRAGIIILLISNVVVFMQKAAMVGTIYVIFMGILLLVYGCPKSCIKFYIVLLGMIAVQRYIFPYAPSWIVILFGIFTNYGRRMLPCLMVGIMLIKTNTMHRFILAMRKMRWTESLVIPVAVAIRYFPAIREEWQHVHEAMKLRKLSVAEKLEGCLVPMMLSATTTAEELAQAAVTRGIENPVRKTSYEEIKIEWMDIVSVGLSLMVAIIVLVIDNRGLL